MNPRTLTRVLAIAATLLAICANSAHAGFLYAVVGGSPKQIYGYSVNEANGTLTPLAGFPVSAGVNGVFGIPTHFMAVAFNATRARLAVLGEASGQVAVFNVDRETGGLRALSWSPITIGIGAADRFVQMHPSANFLYANNGSQVLTYSITDSAATVVGTPIAIAAFNSSISQDGSFFYAGEVSSTNIHGFSINQSTGQLTALAGSPFSNTDTTNVILPPDPTGGFATVSYSSNNLRYYTTAAGIPTISTQGAVVSGGSNAIRGIYHPGGYYMIANSVSNNVAVFKLAGTGIATTLTAVAGSPFGAAGSFTNNVVLNSNGKLLFASNGNSRQIVAFTVAETGVLGAAFDSGANFTGSVGTLQSLAYVPDPFTGFLYAHTEQSGVPNLIYGFGSTPQGGLYPLPGFPVTSTNNGSACCFHPGSLASHSDTVSARLFAINRAGSFDGWNVDRTTGALTGRTLVTLPGSMVQACVTVNPTGSPLMISDESGSRVFSFKLTGLAATPALASPYASGVGGIGCRFSRDGAYAYAVGLPGNIAQYSVNHVNGIFSALAPATVPVSGATPFSLDTDASGRVFATTFSGGSLNVFSSVNGVLTPITAGPVSMSPLSGIADVKVLPGNLVAVSGRSSNSVQTFAVSGSGTGTTLAPIGTPVSAGTSGGSPQSLIYDDGGGVLYAANVFSRSITSFGVAAGGALSRIATQNINTVGTGQYFNGLAFVPVVDKTARRSYNADLRSDLVWRRIADGFAVTWFMNGTAISSSTGAPIGPEWSLAAQGDLDGDGINDRIWWRASDGVAVTWLGNGGGGTFTVGPEWKLIGTGDFNGDGRADVVYQRASDGLAIMWLFDGVNILGSGGYARAGWTLAGVGDFNGDGKADLVWRRNSDGAVELWIMDGPTIVRILVTGNGLEWDLKAVADFNGDGRADLVWRRQSDGLTVIWLMNDINIIGAGSFAIDNTWQLAGFGDYDGDGRADLLWRRQSDGFNQMWLMDGTTLKSGTSPFIFVVGTEFKAENP